MSGAHSPGPWMGYVPADHYWSYAVRAKPGCICVMPGWLLHADTKAEQIANYRLIMAAPELLEALIHMVESITGVDQVSAVNEARAAIFKATNPAEPPTP